MARITRSEDVETEEYIPYQNRYVDKDCLGVNLEEYSRILLLKIAILNPY